MIIINRLPAFFTFARYGVFDKNFTSKLLVLIVELAHCFQRINIFLGEFDKSMDDRLVMVMFVADKILTEGQ